MLGFTAFLFISIVAALFMLRFLLALESEIQHSRGNAVARVRVFPRERKAAGAPAIAMIHPRSRLASRSSQVAQGAGFPRERTQYRGA